MLISEYRVLQSAAGYYIGRVYYEADGGYWAPYSRDTEYFSSLRLAAAYMPTMLMCAAESEPEYAATGEYLAALAHNTGREVHDALAAFN